MDISGILSGTTRQEGEVAVGSTKTAEDDRVDQLVKSINHNVSSDLYNWPGGWPEQIELALLDAVFSIQARYGGPDSGVRAVVKRWREWRETPADDLRELARQDPEALANIVKNRAKVSGRLKAAAAINAAAALSSAGVHHAADFTGSSTQKSAYLSSRGCGPVTWSYLGMLLGKPGVKADTWIMRFVRSAIGSDVSVEEAERLVTAAAEQLNVTATQLDHAIWQSARSRVQLRS